MPPRKHTVEIDGPLVRRARENLDLTQAALADAAHISRQYLIAIEKGSRTTVSRLVLEALAAPLNTNPDLLVVAQAVA